MAGKRRVVSKRRRPQSISRLSHSRRSIPIVVLTAKDLTAEELVLLNGNVHTVLDKGGQSRDELMHQVRDLLADWAVPTKGSGDPKAVVLNERAEVSSHV